MANTILFQNAHDQLERCQRVLRRIFTEENEQGDPYWFLSRPELDAAKQVVKDGAELLAMVSEYSRRAEGTPVLSFNMTQAVHQDIDEILEWANSGGGMQLPQPAPKETGQVYLEVTSREAAAENFGPYPNRDEAKAAADDYLDGAIEELGGELSDWEEDQRLLRFEAESGWICIRVLDRVVQPPEHLEWPKNQ